MSDEFVARPKDTVFNFFNHVFNISLLERLIAAGEVEPTRQDLPIDDVVNAGRLHTYRFIKGENNTWTMKQVEEGGVVGVTLNHALSMTEARKAEPVILVEIPQVLSEDSSKLILIDGLHRTVRHIIDGDDVVGASMIVKPQDLCRFHCYKVDGHAFDALRQPVDPSRIEVRYYWAGR